MLSDCVGIFRFFRFEEDYVICSDARRAFFVFLVCYYQMIFVGSHLANDRLWVILHDCDRAFEHVCDILLRTSFTRYVWPLQ